MNPARILPDLQCSLLCEDIRQEANGNFILIGVLGFLRVPQLPVTALKLCVFSRWTAGVGAFTETVRLIETALPSSRQQVGRLPLYFVVFRLSVA